MMDEEELSDKELERAFTRAKRQRNHYIRKLANDEYGELANIQNINAVHQTLLILARMVGEPS
jgi:hypothetical protein